MYAKRSSPTRNQSNTLQNESLKEEICFGSYFRFVRHKSKTSCREFDISTKGAHAPRPQHASSVKLYTKNNSNCGRVVTRVHSSTHLHLSTLIYTHVLQVHSYSTTPSRNPGPTRTRKRMPLSESCRAAGRVTAP